MTCIGANGLRTCFTVGAGIAFFLALSMEPASAHTPNWASRVLEWVFGKKAAVGDAPSAGWIEPKRSPAFRLVDQDGKHIGLRNFHGKVVLMNFIYSDCGDSCASLKELKILQRALGGRMGKDVIFVSVTLDPERDTPQVLNSLGRQLAIDFTQWKFLTGRSADIQSLVEAYGIYVKRIHDGHQSSHRGIEYGDVVLFLDQEGRLRKRVLPHLLRLSGRPDVEWLLEKHEH